MYNGKVIEQDINKLNRMQNEFLLQRQIQGMRQQIKDLTIIETAEIAIINLIEITSNVELKVW